MILFLPPAPHTGAFFDTVRQSLQGVDTKAVTYPGYGDEPKTAASISAYAAHSLQNKDAILVGFHTGCLVALEMAKQSSQLGRLILVDVPYFDEQTKREYASGLDPENSAHDAFRAAFSYDLDTVLKTTQHEVICIATDSSLYEPTVKASTLIPDCRLIKRRDIGKPAFENAAMADLIRVLAT
ncbi:hypothetical protein DES40_1315 [Litorimonas taeanensis]|uniref:Thioesterase domain-containing protein n=1 Tax=Litorimonas taeanensis TaxID=568099 RepID=A0A420WLX3_9PROT|nr:thioesterase domain-containing protein [Litorimonas taeanensis]RKQ71979.1 hypothetical protein DES40_1315 [Litorimonas taeanensis]